MIVYKGFGHDIDKPKQQQAVMEHNLEWFSRWIWGAGGKPGDQPGRRGQGLSRLACVALGPMWMVK